MSKTANWAPRLSLLPQWFGDPVSLSSVYTSVCVVLLFGVFVIFFNWPKSHRGDPAYRGILVSPVGVLPQGISTALDSCACWFRSGSIPGWCFLLIFARFECFCKGKTLPDSRRFARTIALSGVRDLSSVACATPWAFCLKVSSGRLEALPAGVVRVQSPGGGFY